MSTLLELTAISKHFASKQDVAGRIVAGLLGKPARHQIVRAVDNIDLSIAAGEVVGLVGESGCGKSTLGRVIAGIHPATSGSIHWQGAVIDRLPLARRRQLNLAIQMIFQDPHASLNPRKRVRELIGEAPLVHGLVERSLLNDSIDQLLLRVGLDPSYKLRYPHQLSGGQRQRVGIARALAVRPELLVCDESVAALDVSIQAQVLNLFMQLRHDLGLTYLFISHDLGVIRHIADRVIIMYLGRVVEVAPTEELFVAPNHPYTRSLIAEIPKIVTERRRFSPLQGEIPSPLDPPGGCHFHPRCPLATARCRSERPLLKPIASNRLSACHIND